MTDRSNPGEVTTRDFLAGLSDPTAREAAA